MIVVRYLLQIGVSFGFTCTSPCSRLSFPRVRKSFTRGQGQVRSASSRRGFIICFSLPKNVKSESEAQFVLGRGLTNARCSTFSSASLRFQQLRVHDTLAQDLGTSWWAPRRGLRGRGGSARKRAALLLAAAVRAMDGSFAIGYVFLTPS